MSLSRELHDYPGRQIREPTFEVPLLKISTDDLGRPVQRGLRNW